MFKATNEDRDHYTNGDCWSLAWQIYRLGKQPHALCTLGDKGDWVHGDWYHVVVKIGEDKYLDIEGPRTAKQLRKRWATPGMGFEITEHPEFKNATQYKRHIGRKSWRNLVDDSYAHTVLIAKLLLEEYDNA